MASNSAIIDMDGIGDKDAFEPFHDFDGTSKREEALGNLDSSQSQFHQPQGQARADVDGKHADNFLSSAQQTMTNMMWEAGKTQATKAWSIYGNIDLLRPYFDVEPSDVVKRMINSLIPKPPTSTPTKVVKELYGPTMLVLTLIALLLYEMKSSGHTVKEGTLIGTAFGTCFGYWTGCGTLAWLVAYVCNTHITYLQIVSMIGYSLTAHCLVVLLSTAIHTSHDHVFFYVIWGIFGGLSTLRMLSILISRTHGPSQKLVVSGFVAFLNMAFLLYLHFAYHQIVEEFDDILHNSMSDAKVKSVTEIPANVVDPKELQNS